MSYPKKCVTCRTWKDSDDFSSNGKGRLRSTCRDCGAAKSRARYVANRDAILVTVKHYQAEHADAIKARRREYRAKHRDRINAAKRAAHAARKEARAPPEITL